MQLKRLTLERPEYGKNKGKLIGAVTFSDSDTETSLRLNEEQAAQILTLCAEALVENAKQMSEIMVSRLLEQAPAITDQSKTGE